MAVNFRSGENPGTSSILDTGAFTRSNLRESLVEIWKSLENESICIYCRKIGRSREHVAPASLGGNCTITCVCADCNQELSSADRGLAEHSAVALSKIANTPATAFETHLGGFASFESEEAGAIRVRLGNQMKPEVRPQFRLIGNQIRAVAGNRDSLNELIAFIDKRIGRGELLATRIEIVAEETTAHFCMHRSDDAVVSCASNEAGLKLLTLIQNQWLEIKAGFVSAPERTSTTGPEINIKMKLKPNDEFRGVAKIAFETAVHLLGVATVLGPEFDPIRSYIMGNLQLPETDPASGDLAVDMRFVKPVGTEFKLQFTTHHGVLLLSSPPNLIAFVLLYGTHPYFVQLAAEWKDVPWLRVYEFSYTRDGHNEIDELEFARRVIKTSPELFGIPEESVPGLLQQLGGAN